MGLFRSVGCLARLRVLLKLPDYDLAGLEPIASALTQRPPCASISG